MTEQEIEEAKDRLFMRIVKYMREPYLLTFKEAVRVAKMQTLLIDGEVILPVVPG